jgi:hypothetical protein
MAELYDVYGKAAVEAKDYLDAYTRQRSTAPHSEAEAVRRVRAIIANERTLAEVRTTGTSIPSTGPLANP